MKAFDEHRATAYVFKPDRGENFETWLPLSADDADANRELVNHLRSVRSSSPFVLQERKNGVEINVEVWFVGGEPRMAFMTLECKHKLTGDLGDLTGCAFDFAFGIPLESRAVHETVGRLFPAYRGMRYTGFADANVLVARDGVWFLEKCERFGYNAHPNLFWTVNRAPLGETLRGLIDGTFVADLAPGFGASCSMYMDHPAPGRVIGYYDNVLIANAFGYTIQTAWDTALEVANAGSFLGVHSESTGGARTFRRRLPGGMKRYKRWDTSRSAHYVHESRRCSHDHSRHGHGIDR